MKKGKVYLVGAGPGDPGLITSRGLQCLAAADVVVYDNLLDESLLEAAPARAERIYAGKVAGSHTLEQQEINRLLVAKARAGNTVVRLKGGDPFVLGRGGEEAEELARNKIEFEVVPGVSSATAVPAYAGIPVTHRGLASSFTVITGHEDPRKQVSSIDWKKLAVLPDTLVFLMGMHNLPQIANQLIKHGRTPSTPAAVIQDGTRPGQRTVTGRLGSIAAKVRKAGLTAPAVIVIGEVVGLREKLSWYDNRPLSGRRVLVTRARRQAGTLSRLLAERGALPLELPVIDIRPLSDKKQLDRAIRNLKKYDWIVFTSVNGVEAFFERLHTLKLDSRALHGLRAAAIGPATAGALEQRGIRPDFMPPVFTGKALASGLKKLKIAGKRFLLLRADIAGRELADSLRRSRAAVDEVAVYRTLPAAAASKEMKKLLAEGRVDAITFTSSSTVSNLVSMPGGKSIPAAVKIACIGSRTAAAARAVGLKVHILAGTQTIPGLVDALEDYYRRQTK